MAPPHRGGPKGDDDFPSWPGSEGDESSDFGEARGDGLHGEPIPPEDEDWDSEDSPSPAEPEDEGDV